jgi:hypothetical protein
MDYYMVVQVDAEGMFLDEPEQFNTRAEAARRYLDLRRLEPELEFAVFKCEEITYRLATAEKTS